MGEYTVFYVIVILISCSITSYFSWLLAAEKGYENASHFAFFGFFFSLVGVIVAAGLPDVEAKEILIQIRDSLKSEPNKTDHDNETQDESPQ